jgi:hypothetical protein
VGMGWFGLGLTIPKPNHYKIGLIFYNPNQTKPIKIGLVLFGLTV